MQFVTFKLAPCATLQAHYHTSPELLQVVRGTASVGTVNRTSIFLQFSITTGQLLEIPTGDVHYVANPTCTEMMAIGAWRFGSNTTFLAPTLAALPPTVPALLFGVATPAVRGQAFVPIVTNSSCLSGCSTASSAG